MNIFVTHPDPVICARMLDNKRVVKMVLESAQLLSNALPPDVAPYKPTHMKHPCTLWVKESNGNYVWLLNHLKALCEEYTARYGKVHKCAGLLPLFQKAVGPGLIHQTTKFVNCTEFKDEPNVYFAYQKCLEKKWSLDKRRPMWYSDNSFKGWK